MLYGHSTSGLSEMLSGELCCYGRMLSSSVSRQGFPPRHTCGHWGRDLDFDAHLCLAHSLRLLLDFVANVPVFGLGIIKTTG